ncbi:exonuclease SbcCD subunit D [Candidatus Woesearchaeota archaeon]|nr:exonuclease SbcCD subunit D [Candidatus Woesearchaeota archaeon]HLC80612.1 exonuclease SbcCD subunit D [Candidatus Nanoarchaeia archaeon]
MKFAHLADLHIGSWKEPKMGELSNKAFIESVDICIREKVDFILFAGDLFNTALPAIDKLKLVTKKLKELQDNQIPVYAIPGSHDFSPSGKTMIDVLENAGLLTNVCKGKVIDGLLQLKLTIDQKTGTGITGILGKKGMLDRTYYENLDYEYLQKEISSVQYKIFLFHTTLTELKPKSQEKSESQPVSFLPKGFDYYAGGHLHLRIKTQLPEYNHIIYPGPLFPNNFSELEECGSGGFYIIESTDMSKNQLLTWIPLQSVEHLSIKIDSKHQTPAQIEEQIRLQLESHELHNKLITLRLSGHLISGKVNDINFKSLVELSQQRGAYHLLKNTLSLQSEEMEEISGLSVSNPEETEERIIQEHLQQIKTDFLDKEGELRLIRGLLHAASAEKAEGETKITFEKRILEEIDSVVEIK